MSVVSNQVRCLVTGEETLRFVNLCRNNGIELRHLVRRGKCHTDGNRCREF
mgnify:CR=1 FL=1